MPTLVDASVLIRAIDHRSPVFKTCMEAIHAAGTQRDEFFICAQTMIEFWAVATRPLDVNGLGLTPADADIALADFEKFLTLVQEPPDIASTWRNLARRHGVSGKPAHDCRLVALMHSYGISNILTLNVRDFARYSGIRILSPQDILAGRS